MTERKQADQRGRARSAGTKEVELSRLRPQGTTELARRQAPRHLGRLRAWQRFREAQRWLSRQKKRRRERYDCESPPDDIPS